jgi:hypothetical protein
MTKKWNGFTLSCTMNHYNMLGLSIKKPDAALMLKEYHAKLLFMTS